MSISAGYTTADIRRIVEAYYAQPYGSRKAWLQAQDVSYKRFVRWRAAMYGGDLERGLIPREGAGLSIDHERLKHSSRDRDAALAERDAEIARLNARLAAAERTADALGKAIGLLHARNAQEPVETPAMSDPSSS